MTTGEGLLIVGAVGLVGFVFYKTRIAPTAPDGAPGSRTPPPPALNPEALLIYGATAFYNSFKHNPGGMLNALNPFNSNLKPVHQPTAGHGYFL